MTSCFYESVGKNMKLLFKQRLFSWFDSYDIYDEEGNTVFTVEGQLSWGHCLHILDQNGQQIGMVQERVMTFLPKFEFYAYGEYWGCLKKEFTFLTPYFTLDSADWEISGNFTGWEYEIVSASRGEIATVSKELITLTDTYIINVYDPADALAALMVVLAIDAEKCGRG